MDFYNSIAHYYDLIFPLKTVQADFAQRAAKEVSANSLLDIGCATGAFAYHMSGDMREVFAFDLDENMVAEAATKRAKENILFKQGDMLNITQLLNNKKYDMTTCFGNTLVHIPPDKCSAALMEIKSHTNKMLLIQILNYDYIFDEKISKLPIIENEKIEFIRMYDLISREKIRFITKLIIKESGKMLENEILLYPIFKSQIDSELKEAGFIEKEYFKDYKGNKAGGTHLPLIIKAKA